MEKVAGDSRRNGATHRRDRADQLTEKTAEIFLLPLDRRLVVAELLLAFEKTIVVDDATTRCVLFVGHERMQHFVIHDVLDIPARHELAIQQRMNADDPVFLLDAPEHDVARWTAPAAAAPG